MYSGIYASVDLPPLFVVVPVACTLGDDAGRRIPIVCGHKKYLRSCPRKYSSMIRDNFLFVDLAQLFEQFAERSLDFAAQRCKVLAHQRRIMCIGRIVGLDEKRVAKSHALLHHFENLFLFGRLEADRHVAVEHEFLQTVVDLFFQHS